MYDFTNLVHGLFQENAGQIAGTFVYPLYADVR
jgi:hypothetical protein